MQIQHDLRNYLRRDSLTETRGIDAHQPHPGLVALLATKFESHPRPTLKLRLRAVVAVGGGIRTSISSVVIPDVVNISILHAGWPHPTNDVDDVPPYLVGTLQSKETKIAQQVVSRRQEPGVELRQAQRRSAATGPEEADVTGRDGVSVP